MDTVAFIQALLKHSLCLQENMAQFKQTSNKSTLHSQKNYTNVKIKIYKIIIVSVVLYGCETWCLSLSH